MQLLCLSVVSFLTGMAAEPPAAAQDGPIQLKLVARKDNYAWDAGGMTPEEFRQHLAKLMKDAKSKGGFGAKVPPAPTVDLVLKIVNTSNADVTVHVGGDPNTYTFTLKGPGVVTMANPIAFTADFRMSRPMTLKPGESYDIAVSRLTDGMRGMSRLVYWTDVGEYTLSATYQLSDAQGNRTALLKSEPVKLKVEMKK